MIVTLLFNIIAVFFAWLQDSNQFKHGLKLSLFTVFLFLALRYDFGNDYMGYLDNFLEVNRYSIWDSSLFRIKGNELGWLYLNRLFGPFGFFAMQAVLAGFTCIVLYKFITNYVPHKYYWFAMFFYLFYPGSMLTLSSAMRQQVAVIIFLLAFDFIVQKRWFLYLVLITIATTFHSSAIFLYPFILLSYFNWKLSFSQVLIISIAFVLPIIYVKEVFGFLETLVIEQFDFYEVYTKGSDFSIDVGAGFALNILIYLVVLYFAQSESRKKELLLYKIAVLSLFLIPISFAIPLIGRLGMYLYPVMMAVYPMVFIKMKKTGPRLLYIGVVLFITIYQFYMFFQSPVWIRAFSEYNTIFSAPKFY